MTQMNPHVTALLHAHATDRQLPRQLPRQPGPAADPAPRGASPNPGQTLFGAAAGVSAFAFQGTNAHAVLSRSTPGAVLKQQLQQREQCWQRRRHWFTPLELHVLLSCASAGNASAGGREVLLETRLNRPALAYLWDHRVAGRALLPAAAMLEMAAAAVTTLAQAGGHADEAALSSAAIPAPLALGASIEGSALVLSAVVSARQGTVTIASLAEPHRSGRAKHLTASLGPVPSLVAARMGAAHVPLPALLAAAGLGQGKEHAWAPSPASPQPAAAAVASIEPAGSPLRLHAAGQYRVHPAVLDCATQAGAAFMPAKPLQKPGVMGGSSAATTRVPVGIAVYRANTSLLTLGPNQVAHTAAAAPQLLAEGSALGSYKLASGGISQSGVPDSSGLQTPLDVAGMLFKAVQRPTCSAPGPAASLAHPALPAATQAAYELQWKAARPAVLPDAWRTARCAPPAAQVEWRALSAGAPGQRIVLRCGGASAAALSASLRFVKCQIGKSAAALELRTRGACLGPRACGRATQRAATAAAAALLRVAAQERPALACRHAELDPLALNPHPNTAAQGIAAGADAFGIASSAGVWLHPELAPVAKAATPLDRASQATRAKTWSWDTLGARSAVLVTGGLGNVGALVAAWLAAADVAHVWLAGRSGRFAPGAVAAAAASAVLLSQSDTMVHAVRCDVGTAAGAFALSQYAHRLFLSCRSFYAPDQQN